MTIEEEMKLLADHVYDWCEAVKEDSSWDGWDDYYKAAKYKGTTIGHIVEKYRTIEEGEERK